MITTLQQLCDRLSLSLDEVGLQKVLSDFPLKVTESFVNRMTKGDVNDPLLLQVLPTRRELEAVPGYSNDPVAEHHYNPVPGLLHKYHGRVLLTITGGCAIHCRYCFRRHFPYGQNMVGRSGWQQWIDYIARDPTISEVIFSGGDPLIAKNDYLGDLISQLRQIPQLKRLRIHTRIPIVDPDRINQALIDCLSIKPRQLIVVLHSNHANELDHVVAGQLALFQQANITLFNQTVLLKGINDQVDTLIELSERLFEIGVLPYYLHVLDPVAGAAHFDIEPAQAKCLHKAMQARLPGYLVPKLVQEIPGHYAKTLLS